MLCRSDSGKDGKTVDTRLDIGRSALYSVISRLAMSLSVKPLTNSSANIFAALEIWSLGAAKKIRELEGILATSRLDGRRTNDKRDHGGSVSSSGLKPLDEFLHLPYLDVLLRFVRLSRAHVGRGNNMIRPDEGKGVTCWC